MNTKNVANKRYETIIKVYEENKDSEEKILNCINKTVKDYVTSLFEEMYKRANKQMKKLKLEIPNHNSNDIMLDIILSNMDNFFDIKKAPMKRNEFVAVILDLGTTFSKTIVEAAQIIDMVPYDVFKKETDAKGLEGLDVYIKEGYEILNTKGDKKPC